MKRLAVPLSRQRGLAILLACYLGLGIVYGLATPTFEASDELYHYLYVKQVADGSGLPVQTPAGDNPALQEASQPPLYYLLAAAATFWIDTGPLADTHRLNPHAAKGEPGASGNKNMVIHGPEESFPWRGPALAVRIIRLLSLLLGAGTVVVTYAVARELLPGRPAAALGAATITALIPQFLFIGAAVNNDDLVTLLGALTLLLSLRVARGVASRRRLVLLGAVAGLAAVTKVSGLMAIPLALVALAWLAWRERSIRRLVVGGVLIAGSALLFAGWWYGRNWVLYGDPLGISAMLAVAGGRQAGFGLNDLLREQEGLRWSFWAVFGGFNVVADRWVYWVYDVLMAVAGLGIVVTLARRAIRGRAWGSGEGEERVEWEPAEAVGPGVLKGLTVAPLWVRWGLALLWLALLLAGLIGWSLSTMGSQGRLLFPALPTIAALLFVGLTAWLPRRPLTDRVAAVAVAAPLALLAGYLPFAYIMPAYVPPALSVSAAAIQAPNPLNVDYGGQMELAGFSVDRQAAQPGGVVNVTLYWQALSSIEKDYSFFIHVYGPDGAIVGQVDSYPGHGAFATSRLSPGAALADTYAVRLSPKAAAGMSQIAAGLYDVTTKEMLPGTDGQGRQIEGAVPLAQLRLVPGDESELASAKPVGANLGGEVALAGYRLEAAEVGPGDRLSGTLYWRALAHPKESYTVFVHLLGPEGQIAQHDAQPRGGEYRTSDWAPGDVVGDPFSMQVPDWPPGEYQLVAGMYRLEGGQRLPVQRGLLDRLAKRLGRKGGDLPDAVSLGTVRVTSPGG